MLKVKKPLIIRLISLLILAIFLPTNAYTSDVFHLRVPMIDKYRLEDTEKAMAKSDSQLPIPVIITPEDIQLYRMSRTSKRTPSKIIFLVIDGVSGVHVEEHGGTELEIANHPNLDNLINKGAALGSATVISSGVVPGSGAGHFSMFGSNQDRFTPGRGILEALGSGVELEAGDIIVRGNFATINKENVVTDRRAGRVPTDINNKLVKKCLSDITIDGVNVEVHSSKEHRLAVVLKGKDLSSDITDSDPGSNGEKPWKVEPTVETESAQLTAKIVNNLIEEINKRLKNQNIYPKARTVLFRDFGQLKPIPTFGEVYKLKAFASALYPAYRGIAFSLGMVLQFLKGKETISFKDQVDTVLNEWGNYDFFYVHVKGTDSTGEDGNFLKKVSIIEEVDSFIPELMTKMSKGDVLVVTADHATPAGLKAHSFQSVPVMIFTKGGIVSKRRSLKGTKWRFTEDYALSGSLGHLNSSGIMPLVMGFAGKLDKQEGSMDLTSPRLLSLLKLDLTRDSI